MKREITAFLILLSFLSAASCDNTLEAVDQAFQCDIRLEKSYVYDGETLSVEVTTNRTELKVTAFSSPVEFPQLQSGSTLSISSGSRSYESDAVAVEKAGEGTIAITVKDSVTEEEKSFNLDFKKMVEEVVYPTRIVIETDYIRNFVNKGETLTIPVTVQPDGCSSDIIIRDITDGLTASPSSRNRSCTVDYLESRKYFPNHSVAYAHTESVNGSCDVMMKFGKLAGLSKFRIQSFYNPTVYQDIEVYIREDVAILLELDGKAVHEGYYGEGYSGRSYGFAGYIKPDFNFTAKVRTFDILDTTNDSTAFVSSTSIGDDNMTVLKEHWTNDHIQLNKPEYEGDFTIEYYIKCQPEQMSSSFFYGACGSFAGGWGGSGLYKNHYKPDEAPAPYTFPKVTSEKVTIHSGDDGEPLKALTASVNNCNDVQAFDFNYGGSDHLHETAWAEFDIYHRPSITYDHNHFNVRYIIYTFKCKTGTGNDKYIGGGRPWFLSDVAVNNGKQNRIVGEPDVWCYPN